MKDGGPPADEAYVLALPEAQSRPLVVASPHSGRCYPPDLLAASQLDLNGLRRSEDSFVDELFAGAVGLGAPLIAGQMARVYVDLNREAWELDPAMFSDPLPDWVNKNSPRLASGLGTLARLVADGRLIYRRKLSFDEASERVNRIYIPYHEALEGLIAQTQTQFGSCLLLDAHSMPSGAGAGERQKADFVLGDRYGTSCKRSLVEAAEAFLSARGYHVVRNAPYAGGFTTCHYGQPAAGRHALQIEINRALYMDETRFCKRDGFEALAVAMTELMICLDERFCGAASGRA